VHFHRRTAFLETEKLDPMRHLGGIIHVTRAGGMYRLRLYFLDQRGLAAVQFDGHTRPVIRCAANCHGIDLEKKTAPRCRVFECCFLWRFCFFLNHVLSLYPPSSFFLPFSPATKTARLHTTKVCQQNAQFFHAMALTRLRPPTAQAHANNNIRKEAQTGLYI
jgi:hypothetical protein